MTKPVVIIGGGAIGSSIAVFLSSLDPARRVIVIERDPTYVRASSALSTSSLRQQFSTPVNIQLSQFGYQFMSESAETTSYVSLMPRGYLFLAQAHQEAELRDRTKIARSYGAKLREYDPIELNGECP
uniref:FAD-dependent oxidoreductase n=1 Tax=uncultured Caballeronia sp. TaxID=1827198 RepID=UPI0035CA6D0A